MAQTYFFYDLETTGLNPRDDRIMQFAGIRTDMEFNHVGESYNVLVAVNDDTLPSPQALMVTGVTPQQTVADGYAEAQFARIFTEEIATPDTIMIGFNNIRFDDEFMRAFLWRNYYDPYEWTWKDGRSRWDMLDVVRMTRALRPEGINWPVVDGREVNKLELLSAENGIDHLKAHDALSDVEALIGVTKLIATQQPQLYQYLLKMRDKKEIQKLVNLDDIQPFVYSSGRYDAEYHKTTVAMPLAAADYGNVFVYDLRYDPTQWLTKTEAELADIVFMPYDTRPDDYEKLPVKKLQYNRAPAVAPLGVLSQADGWTKLQLTQSTVEKHRGLLLAHPEFAERVARVLLKKPEWPPIPDAEGQLYDGFVSDRDKLRSEVLHNTDEKDIKLYKPEFDDTRLKELFPRYKVRNFPRAATPDELASYELWRSNRLHTKASRFVHDMQTVTRQEDLSDHQKYVLEELKLWFESIMPEPADTDTSE